MDQNPSDPEQQTYDRVAAIVAALIVAACFASVGYRLQVAKGHSGVAKSACADHSSLVYRACLESFSRP